MHLAENKQISHVLKMDYKLQRKQIHYIQKYFQEDINLPRFTGSLNNLKVHLNGKFMNFRTKRVYK